ncbi:MAG: hypothetical protein ACPIOQ_25185, partial [Promethearchaeia archaeon]
PIHIIIRGSAGYSKWWTSPHTTRSVSGVISDDKISTDLRAAMTAIITSGSGIHQQSMTV